MNATQNRANAIKRFTFELFRKFTTDSMWEIYLFKSSVCRPEDKILFFFGSELLTQISFWKAHLEIVVMTSHAVYNIYSCNCKRYFIRWRFKQVLYSHFGSFWTCWECPLISGKNLIKFNDKFVTNYTNTWFTVCWYWKDFAKYSSNNFIIYIYLIKSRYMLDTLNLIVVHLSFWYIQIFWPNLGCILIILCKKYMVN